jgi:HEPN domain-containing protein
MASRAKDWLR